MKNCVIIALLLFTFNSFAEQRVDELYESVLSHWSEGDLSSTKSNLLTLIETGGESCLKKLLYERELSNMSLPAFDEKSKTDNKDVLIAPMLAKEELESDLQRVIGHYSLNKASPSQAIALLQKKIRQLDKKGKNVNFIFINPSRNVKKEDNNSFQPITIDVDNFSINMLIRYLSESMPKIQYKIEPYGVMFAPQDSPIFPIKTKVFHLRDHPLMSNTADTKRPGKSGVSQIDTDDIVTANKRLKELYSKKYDIRFPPGTGIFFSPLTNNLVVTHTPEVIKRFKSLHLGFYHPPPMVRLTFQSIKISGNEAWRQLREHGVTVSALTKIDQEKWHIENQISVITEPDVTSSVTFPAESNSDNRTRLEWTATAPQFRIVNLNLTLGMAILERQQDSPFTIQKKLSFPKRNCPLIVLSRDAENNHMRVLSICAEQFTPGTRPDGKSEAYPRKMAISAEKIRQLTPEQLLDYGNLYYHSFDAPKKAVVFLEEALSRDRDLEQKKSLQCMLNIAKCRFEMGEYEEVKKNLRQLLTGRAGHTKLAVKTLLRNCFYQKSIFSSNTDKEQDGVNPQSIEALRKRMGNKVIEHFKVSDQQFKKILKRIRKHTDASIMINLTPPHSKNGAVPPDDSEQSYSLQKQDKNKTKGHNTGIKKSPSLPSISMDVYDMPIPDILRFACLKAGLRWYVCEDAVKLAPREWALAPMDTRFLLLPSNPSLPDREKKFRKILRNAGVQFPYPAEFDFDSRTPKTFVHNTTRNLMLIGEIIKASHKPQRPVRLNMELFEISNASYLRSVSPERWTRQAVMTIPEEHRRLIGRVSDVSKEKRTSTLYRTEKKDEKILTWTPQIMNDGLVNIKINADLEELWGRNAPDVLPVLNNINLRLYQHKNERASRNIPLLLPSPDKSKLRFLIIEVSKH